MIVRVFLSCLLVALVGSRVLLAQDQVASDRSAEFPSILTRVVDPQTTAVLEIRPERVNLDSLMNAMSAADIPLLTGVRGWMADMDQLLRELAIQDVERCHAIFSLADVPRDMPFVVLSNADRAAAELTTNEMLDLGRQAIESWELTGHTIVGSVRTRKRLAQIRFEDPEFVQTQQAFAEAFSAAGDMGLHLVVRPSDDQRRVLRTLRPEIQGFITSDDWPSLTAIEWLTAAISFGEQDNSLRLRGRVENDWQANERLSSLFRTSIPNVGAQDVWDGNRFSLDVPLPEGLSTGLQSTLIKHFFRHLTGSQFESVEDQLRQLTLALFNHHSAFKSLPGPEGSSEHVGSGLSWRVRLLPFLGHQDLYREFHLKEPWDSPHNRQLIAKMPIIFLTLGSQHRRSSGLSTYRLSAGEGRFFGDGTDRKLESDEASQNTIMLVEVPDDRAVIWTRPESYQIDPDQADSQLGGHQKDGFYAVTGSGQVLYLNLSQTAEIRRRLNINGD